MRYWFWIVVALLGLLMARAAWAQLPDPTLPPDRQPRPTLLDFPAVSEFDDLRGSYAWSTAEADYAPGLSAEFVRRHRIREVRFGGSGRLVMFIAPEPGDLLMGHNIRREEEEPQLQPFRPDLVWQFRYAYDTTGRLLEAEGRQRSPLSYGVEAAAGWRVRKRYDAQHRLTEIDLSSYGRNDRCPDTLLGNVGWHQWLRYDAAGRVSRVVEQRRDRGYRSDGCRPTTHWEFGYYHYEGPRLAGIRYYSAPDSARAAARHPSQQVRYCYDAAGRRARLVRLSVRDTLLPTRYGHAWQRTYPPAAAGAGWQVVTQHYDADFSALDTLTLCAPRLRADPDTTQRRPLISGARYFAVDSAVTEQYDALGRLLRRRNPDHAYEAADRVYRPDYLAGVSCLIVPTTRLLLLRPDGRPARELLLWQADAYEEFNELPSAYDDKEPSRAEKYDWHLLDGPATRLLKQYRTTLVDYRYDYDPAGLLRALTVRGSLNRQAVRRRGRVSGWLTRQLLGPYPDASARGLRRIVRRHPQWPYEQADYQRYGDFRYVYY